MLVGAKPRRGRIWGVGEKASTTSLQTQGSNRSHTFGIRCKASTSPKRPCRHSVTLVLRPRRAKQYNVYGVNNICTMVFRNHRAKHKETDVLVEAAVDMAFL